MKKIALASLLSLVAAAPAAANTLKVGPGEAYAAPCAALMAAGNGDTIEIAAGVYSGDVCSFGASNLTIRGTGGRPKIDAAGQNAAGKGTWVMGGNDNTVENVEMLGASVPDQNGAAIRFEGTNLTLRGVYFHDNEDGLLCGANLNSTILIEGSEFSSNGFGDGYSHNMYIGNIKQFTLRYSKIHHAKVGHNVKSRAQRNYILYNLIYDGPDGTASYSVDLSNGGTSFIIGNAIQQGPNTQNPGIVAYAAEGASNPGHDLYVINNSFQNDLGSGTFVQMGSGTDPVQLKNNIFAGGGTVSNQAGAVQSTNFTGSPGYADAASNDFHLGASSPCVNAGADPGMGAGESLVPLFEYAPTNAGVPRTSVGMIDIGAYEYGNPAMLPGGTDDGGAGSPDGATSGSANDGAITPDGGNTDGTPESGCGCTVGGRAGTAPWALLWTLFVVGLAIALRRKKREESP